MQLSVLIQLQLAMFVQLQLSMLLQLHYINDAAVVNVAAIMIVINAAVA